MMENIYLKIDESMKLKDLSDIVGSKNLPAVLNVNGLERCVNIGAKHLERCERIYESPSVPFKRKEEILNSFSTDSDVFEHASVQDENGWKILSASMAFIDAIKIPSYIDISKSDMLLGNGIPVSNRAYRNAMDRIRSDGSASSMLDEYSSAKKVELSSNMSSRSADSGLFHHFKVPWGEITFYSSLSGESVDIPVYPHDIKDSRSATYESIDVLYEYEPIVSYSSSNHSPVSFTFSDIHRQMWSGDELDGEANRMIRFIQASLYPRYRGSNVNSDTVTLYISGKPYITGILTNCEISWKGPIGRDMMQLAFDMTIEIQEVSPMALNYDSVRRLPMIGY